MVRLIATLSEKQKTSIDPLTPPVVRTDKPWGYEILWAKTKDYVGKILFVKKGESLSLQYHNIKEETLFIETGSCIIETGDDAENLKPLHFSNGGVFHVFPKRLHRIIAVTDCRIFEVSTPQLDDVVRLKDLYGRQGT